MASTRLSKTFSGNGDRQKFTFSAWIKRTTTSQSFLWTSGSYSSSSMTQWLFDNDGTLGLYDYNSSGSVLSNVVTNRKFRDTSAWYHIVIRVDTTQSTAADRIRIYVNGVQETSFSATNYPGQNDNYIYSESITAQYIGQRADQGNTSSFEGLMTHIHWTDGYSYDASSFGETDSTSGIWKPKTSPSVTYGTNGYFLKMENSAAMGTDSSGNSNTFATSGTLTQNADTPSNNFSTLNPLDAPYPGQSPTYSNGALTGAGTETGFLAGASSFAVSSGKWYAEFKLTVGTSSLQAMGVITTPVGDLENSALHDSAKFYGVRGNGTKIQPGGGGGETASWTASWTTNDIISLALDMDNNRMYIAKNGQYADGAGAYNQAFTGSPAFLTLASDETYHFIGGSISTGSGVSLTMQANFGSGFFGTTAVASANADANGFGAFEYAVPSGYYTLNTKNIKEFG
mgnify:FL=1